MDLLLFLSLQDGGIILYSTTEWSEAFSSEEESTILEGEYWPVLVTELTSTGRDAE